MEKVGAYTDRVTESGEWRPGNPASGQQATPMLAAWFNMLQRELVGLVTGAGIALDKQDEGQVLKSIRALALAAPKAWSAITDKPSTIAGYGITDAISFKFGDEGAPTDISWDTLTAPGLYPQMIRGDNPGGPGTSAFFYCRTYRRSDGGAVQQFAEPYATPGVAGAMYWRGMNGNTWSNWNRVIGSDDHADQASAEAGTSTAVWMSPLRVAQAISKKVAASAISLSANGYVVFGPSHGGLVIQWGRVFTPTADAEYSVSFPMAFPNAVFTVLASFGYNDSRINDGCVAQTRLITQTGFIANRQDIGATSSLPNSYIHYLTIGY